MNITEKVHSRLLEAQANPRLLKFIKFSMEDLNDNPTELLKSITDYFERHADNIEDFTFIPYFDEETMSPRLIAVIQLDNEMTKYLSSPIAEKLIKDLKKENENE